MDVRSTNEENINFMVYSICKRQLTTEVVAEDRRWKKE
jgi:hypothetical protein